MFQSWLVAQYLFYFCSRLFILTPPPPYPHTHTTPTQVLITYNCVSFPSCFQSPCNPEHSFVHSAVFTLFRIVCIDLSIFMCFPRVKLNYSLWIRPVSLCSSSCFWTFCFWNNYQTLKLAFCWLTFGSSSILTIHRVIKLWRQLYLLGRSILLELEHSVLLSVTVLHDLDKTEHKKCQHWSAGCTWTTIGGGKPNSHKVSITKIPIYS